LIVVEFYSAAFHGTSFSIRGAREPAPSPQR
jgi:hypothetical protein